jgi:hypothetical protein
MEKKRMPGRGVTRDDNKNGGELMLIAQVIGSHNS